MKKAGSLLEIFQIMKFPNVTHFTLSPWLALFVIASGCGLSVEPSLAQTTALTQPALVTHKKFIAHGHDTPTNQQLRRDIAVMDKGPFDGVVIEITGSGPGASRLPLREGFNGDPWREEWFEGAIADLQAVKASNPKKLKSNFAHFLAQPGSVDWFDDAAWKNIVEHWRIAAKVAKRGGLEGICFDPEPYTKPFAQFDYRSQAQKEKHTFAQYKVKARQRGREVMKAVAKEYPDITILNLFLLSYPLYNDPWLGPRADTAPDPQKALMGHWYSLLPAFLDGWLDEATPAVKIVDGNERGYEYISSADFDEATRRVKVQGQTLIAPENRAKYRAQVQSGFAIYVDVHDQKLMPKWLPVSEEKPADYMRRRIGYAADATEEYVWFYYDSGRFWPSAEELIAWPSRQRLPDWETLMPGVRRAIEEGRDIQGADLANARALVATQNLPNLLKNADFSEGPGAPVPAIADWGNQGAPKHWMYWQEAGSKGTFGYDPVLKAAKIQGATYGNWIQGVPCKPKQKFYVRGRAKVAGEALTGITVRFQDAESNWTAGEMWRRFDLPQFLAGSPDAQGWSTIEGIIEAPSEQKSSLIVSNPARHLVLMPFMSRGRNQNDIAWFDDIELYAITP